MEFIVFPLKDFLIAMCFTSLYYYQGMSDQKGLKDKETLGMPKLSGELKKTNEVVEENQ